MHARTPTAEESRVLRTRYIRCDCTGAEMLAVPWRVVLVSLGQLARVRRTHEDQMQSPGVYVSWRTSSMPHRAGVSCRDNRRSNRVVHYSRRRGSIEVSD